MNETRNPYQPPSSPVAAVSDAYSPGTENKFSRFARYSGWSCFGIAIAGSSAQIPLVIGLACLPGILSLCFVVSAKISAGKPVNRNSHVKGSAWVLAVLAFLFTALIVASATAGYISYRDKVLQRRQTQSHSESVRSSSRLSDRDAMAIDGALS